jgi:hypothetical protein
MNQFDQLYEPLFGYNQNILENNVPMNPLENINVNYDQTQVLQSDNIAQHLVQNHFNIGFANGQNEFFNSYTSNNFIESNLNFNQEKAQPNDFTQFQMKNYNYPVLNNNLTFMNVNPFMNPLDGVSISHDQAQNIQLSNFNQSQQSDMIKLEFGDNLRNLVNDIPMNPIEASNMVHNKTQKPEQSDSTKYISDILNLPVTGEYLNNPPNNHHMDPFGESLLINRQFQSIKSSEVIQQKFTMPEQTIFNDYINSFSNTPDLISLKADNTKCVQKSTSEAENSPTEKCSETPALAASSSQKRQLDTIDEEDEEGSQFSKTQKLNNNCSNKPTNFNLNTKALNNTPKLPSKKVSDIKNPLTKTRKQSVKICTKKNTTLTFEFNSIIESKRRIRAKDHIIPISIIKVHKPFEYVTEGILSKTENEIDLETEANTELNGCVWNEDY